MDKRENDDLFRKIDAIYDYVKGAESGFLGNMTSTPARAAVSTMVLMLLFIVILTLIATNNSELIVDILGLVPGTN